MQSDGRFRVVEVDRRRRRRGLHFSLSQRCSRVLFFFHVARNLRIGRNDRDVVADAPLGAVARLVHDVIADPHRGRAAAIEIDRGADLKRAGHPRAELPEGQARNVLATAVSDDEVERRPVFRQTGGSARMR